MSTYKSREFLRLQAEWYERLRETGFKDIEMLESPLDYRNANYRDREAIATYYTVAVAYQESGEFPSPREREIWRLHSQGLSHREIVRLVQCTRWAVEAVLAKHRPLAGLKKRRGNA